MQKTLFGIGIFKIVGSGRESKATGGHVLTPLATVWDLCVLTVPLAHFSFFFIFPLSKNIFIKVLFSVLLFSFLIKKTLY